MGQPQPTGCRTHAASPSRFPPRQCHRKGCDHTFVPQRWNQRYCREPECLQLLQRWQAAKRQQRRRARAEVRQQHAEAQRQRRQRQRAEAGVRQAERSPQAAEAPAPRAWSRSKKNLHDFCDRPGCFEPRRPSRSCTGPLLRRRLPPGRPACTRSGTQVEAAQAPRRGCRAAVGTSSAAARAEAHGSVTGPPHSAVRVAARPAHPVRHYRDGARRAVSSRETHPEVPTHDQETSAGPESRAPPSA